MPGGNDPGLATYRDWSARREEVLADAQGGLAQKLNGNQVFLDLVIGDRSDQTMRLTFMLFEQCPLACANFHALCTHSILSLIHI